MNFFGLLLTFIIIAIAFIIYVNLTRSRNKIRNIYNIIDSSFNKRFNLINKLIEIIKEYYNYEDTTLEKIEELKIQDFDGLMISKKSDVNDKISKLFEKLTSIAESNFDLSINETYVNISKSLYELESEIVKCKEDYDNLVNIYNKKIEKFPNNLVAILFGFNEEKTIIIK